MGDFNVCLRFIYSHLSFLSLPLLTSPFPSALPLTRQAIDLTSCLLEAVRLLTATFEKKVDDIRSSFTQPIESTGPTHTELPYALTSFSPLLTYLPGTQRCNPVMSGRSSTYPLDPIPPPYSRPSLKISPHQSIPDHWLR
jgi:hypothetical protein